MRTPTLCESFRSLAFRTFDQMGRAKAVDHQPLEETFTDMNILELKVRHASEIHCRLFNKREEGTSGADWEWWLTNSTGSSWLGLRVQAKVLQLKSDSFPHLHYKSGKSKTYQSTKLKRECAKEGLIPLYGLYVHEEPIPSGPHRRCGSFAHSPESYGCALTSLPHVERLQKDSERNDRIAVLSEALPWHCLVCCSGYGGEDLPTRAWSLIRGNLGVSVPRRQVRETAQALKGISIGPRSQPPEYVRAIFDGRPSDTSPSHARGVLVVQGREDG